MKRWLLNVRHTIEPKEQVPSDGTRMEETVMNCWWCQQRNSFHQRPRLKNAHGLKPSKTCPCSSGGRIANLVLLWPLSSSMLRCLYDEDILLSVFPGTFRLVRASFVGCSYLPPQLGFFVLSASRRMHMAVCQESQWQMKTS